MRYLLKKRKDSKILILLFILTGYALLYPYFARAADLSVYTGYFGPESDGLDSQYDTKRMARLQLNIPYHDSFDWVTGYTRVDMESNIKGIDSDLNLDILILGVEKKLDDQGENISLNPFLGFGINRVRIKGSKKQESGGSDFEDDSTQYSWGSYWEIGTLISLTSETSLVFQYTRQHIEKTVFGDLSVGGHFMLFGVRTSL